MEKMLMSEYLTEKMEEVSRKIQEARNISDGSSVAYYQGQLDLLTEINRNFRHDIEINRVRSL